MDWDRALSRNRDALLGIVAALFALLGLQDGGTLAAIPSGVRRAALRVLLPAESAVRRLIVIAARGLVVKPPPSRAMPAERFTGQGRGLRLSFSLFDPRRRVAPSRGSASRVLPRIHVFTSDPRVLALWPRPQPAAEPAPPPDRRIEAERFCWRLHAIKIALDDLPRQARRLVRWRTRREKTKTSAFISPLRPGRPPGHRRTSLYEVDDVLRECHGLAFDATMPDTS